MSNSITLEQILTKVDYYYRTTFLFCIFVLVLFIKSPGPGLFSTKTHFEQLVYRSRYDEKELTGPRLRYSIQ